MCIVKYVVSTGHLKTQTFPNVLSAGVFMDVFMWDGGGDGLSKRLHG